MLTASMDTNNFFTEAHAKLRPVESPTAGVFLSGVCQGPKDVPETVAQASAAASKVIALLAKDKLKGNPCVAHSDEMMCNGCSMCQNVCPYGAISLSLIHIYRSIKSELKKVVWSPKREVKKNTVIVLVFVAAFAILIGLLDFLFSKGIIALGKLFCCLLYTSRCV